MNPFFLFKDTETTSLDTKAGAVTQWAGLLVQNRIIVDKIDLRIKPAVGLKIESRALQIQNRSLSSVLEHELEEPEACDAIINFVGGRDVIVVGHNINFDLAFTGEMFSRCQKPLYKEFTNDDTVICTVKMAERILGKKGHKDTPVANHKLVTLCEYFGLPTDGAHGALFDTERCYDVYNKLRDLEDERSAA